MAAENWYKDFSDVIERVRAGGRVANFGPAERVLPRLLAIESCIANTPKPGQQDLSKLDRDKFAQAVRALVIADKKNVDLCDEDIRQIHHEFRLLKLTGLQTLVKRLQKDLGTGQVAKSVPVQDSSVTGKNAPPSRNSAAAKGGLGSSRRHRERQLKSLKLI